nr:reverse transcriptase domain-containing protein [Tanacetum cinerariifolium]
AAIRQLVVDSIIAVLKAQAANMANANNTNRNPKPRESLVARKCSYKEFMSYQPFNFKGSKGAVGLICWFERTKSVFSRSNYTKDCKVKFATGTLTEEALSWWNSFAQPIGIEEAYKITWELATLCPTTVSDSEEMMEAFIGGLPQSAKGNVIASKPHTLEEAINIAQRIMDQYHAKIICDEKVVYIPIDGETLIIQGDQRAELVARAPYRLAPSKMHELSDQLQELADRALPEGNNDFIVYCDASHQGLGAVLMQREKHILDQKELNVRQRRWLELLAGYDCEIRYHPGKANVVAGALSQKERIKPLRVRSLVMIIHPKLPS